VKLYMVCMEQNIHQVEIIIVIKYMILKTTWFGADE
jgi:hypothetical protein